VAWLEIQTRERTSASRGKVVKTEERLNLVKEGLGLASLRDALWWGGGPVGVAETYYPHPKGWTFEGARPGQTLDPISVRALTALFRQRLVRPSCEAKWQQVLGFEFDFTQLVWVRFTSPLITPRDFKNYYRIVNRSMLTRNINPEATSLMCRLCKRSLERFSHIGKCQLIKRTFAKFVEYARNFLPGIRLTEGLIYLGLCSTKSALTGSLSALHIILWKFVVIAFVQAEVRGKKYVPEVVWWGAVRRYLARMKVYEVRVQEMARRAVSRGRNFSPDRVSVITRPCMSFDEGGECEPTPQYARLIYALTVYLKVEIPNRLPEN